MIEHLIQSNSTPIKPTPTNNTNQTNTNQQHQLTTTPTNQQTNERN
jgi:hypothetical protein